MVMPPYVLRNNSLRAITIRGDKVIGLFDEGPCYGPEERTQLEEFIKHHQLHCATYEFVITSKLVEVVDFIKIVCPSCLEFHELIGEFGIKFEPMKGQYGSDEMTEYVKDVELQLEKEIQKVPMGFYDTFGFTQTGNDLTHSVTLGYLSRVLWRNPEVIKVGIDVHLQGKDYKMRPDLIAYDNMDRPLILLDYESPNSSDARIPAKDVKAFEATKLVCPYVIITTLPGAYAPDWELRYTAKDYYNENHKGKLEEIRKNPKEYWYAEYKREIPKFPPNIHFLNINAKKIESIRW